MTRRAAVRVPDVRSIVNDRTFILATRDTGYRDVAAAVAELIDNSLQADATSVRVIVTEEEDRSPRMLRQGAERTITIAVVDDGCGMTPETLRTALQFGGTNRFDDRSGFGRFGMGLPNSSVSQTRRLEVYSWRDSQQPLYSYLDVDEVAAGSLRAIPTPSPRPLPTWLAADLPASGTAVVWSRCDRLGRLRANTIAQRLNAPLGRMYRYAIWSGTKLWVNGSRLRAIDPLFLRGDRPLNEATPYGNRLRYEFTAPADGTTSTVEIQFSELPISAWHDWTVADKRRYGLVGGAGVSIVRAGREIDYGWHLMGGKRRENYDDWWRCEVRFSPALDELFGVTHSKQGISPKAELRSTLGPDLEAIARLLNSRARSAFEELKSAAASPATIRASEIDRFLEAPHAALADRVGGLRYAIDVAPLASPAFYSATMRSGMLRIVVNQDHPFYRNVYKPVCSSLNSHERYRIECLLLAAARADIATVDKREQSIVARLRSAWSDALAVLLDGPVAR
jgi:hypothetical protein